MPFNERQRRWLFKKLDMRRVKTRQGMGYLEAWDVIAHLNRVFGFEGWSKEVTEVEMIFDDFVEWTKDGQKKQGWDVTYRATVRLVVRDPNGTVAKVSEDVATGAALHQPSHADAHDLAIKTAVSDALKRAAKDLGDQYGLGLYNDGTGNSFTDESLAYTRQTEDTMPHDPEKVRTEVAAVRDKMLGERDPSEHFSIPTDAGR